MKSYFIIAVLGAICLITNISQPINALILPHQQDNTQESNISKILGNTVSTTQQKNNNGQPIYNITIVYVNNTQQPIIDNNNGDLTQSQRDQINAQLTDVILPSDEETTINNIPYYSSFGKSSSFTITTDNNNDNDGNNEKHIKTNHDDTQDIVNKMVKEGKLVDGQTIAVPKHPPQQYEDENEEGLPFDAKNVEYEGIVKEATDNYVIINGSPTYIDTKINGNLVDYNDETHNPIINVGDLEMNGYTGSDTLHEQQQDHLKVLGKDKPRSLDETNKEREALEEANSPENVQKYLDSLKNNDNIQKTEMNAIVSSDNNNNDIQQQDNNIITQQDDQLTQSDNNNNVESAPSNNIDNNDDNTQQQDSSNNNDDNNGDDSNDNNNSDSSNNNNNNESSNNNESQDSENSN